MAVNLRIMYDDRADLEISASRHSIFCELPALMNTLMDIANIHPFDVPGYSQSWIVRSKYQFQRAAQLALFEAYQTTTPEFFRAKVLSWKRSGVEIPFGPFGDAYKTKDDVKNESKFRARKNILMMATHMGSVSCENPDCRTLTGFIEQLLRCSRCKCVSYCSKECQLAHWKAYRPTCPKP
ncbi:hypothetical protein MPSEU_000985000 [Mayamaea pseudoterrestris]|nr:hypothetical protein MPSEU_000985000 [Mayamaea pseudoterrestris]